MLGKVSYVDWGAAFNIWVGQVGRVLVANLLVYVFMSYVLPPLTVIQTFITNAYKYEEGLSLTSIALLEVVITMWAGRQSLMDTYPRFRFIAQNKATKQSIFGYDKRLTWTVFIRVWWAQTWRMLLVPVAAILGSLTALRINHPHAANYSHLMHPMLIEITGCSLFLFSLLATKESLADRYGSFRFSAEPKTFYRDGTNS